MSQSNVEIMRAAIEAFNRRDDEAFGAFLTNDAEIVPVRAALEGTVYRGPDAATQYCAAVEESWENLRWEVEEVRDGGTWVLALGRIRGRGRGSGAVIDARGAWLARFGDGSITNFRTYPDRGEALEAVELSGEPVSQANVEIVRASYQAFNADDMASALAALDPAIEVFDHDVLDAAESYRGLEGVARWQAHWEASWASWRWEPEEFIDAGDRVIAVLRVYAKGRGSGVDVERVDGAVWTLRGGKCIRLDYYGSKQQALKAVGLEG
jgi:ketosteroid isomerase-like protein